MRAEKNPGNYEWMNEWILLLRKKILVIIGYDAAMIVP